MPRPRKPDAEVTAAALRKRQQRARLSEGNYLVCCVCGNKFHADNIFSPKPAGQITNICSKICLDRMANAAAKEAREIAGGRLVPALVYVPKGDEKAIEFAAARLRKAARISEDEVPE